MRLIDRAIDLDRPIYQARAVLRGIAMIALALASYAPMELASFAFLVAGDLIL
jgi:hypothetical protein